MNQTIENIKQAIKQATGKEFEAYKIKSKKLELFFPRMIFAYSCYHSGITKKKLTLILDLTWATIHHSVNRYPVEFETNSKFREIAQQVTNHLNQ